MSLVSNRSNFILIVIKSRGVKRKHKTFPLKSDHEDRRILKDLSNKSYFYSICSKN